MIDTDKYEGHTPGPWVALHRYWPKKGFHGGGLREEGSDEAGNYAESHIYTEAYAYAENGETYNIPSTDWGSICGGVCIEDMATANLVADAPLLLEEVKRLRVIEERYRRMGNVLADYCIEDVCDEFFEGDYSFYERLVKAYRWKEGDEECR